MNKHSAVLSVGAELDKGSLKGVADDLGQGLEGISRNFGNIMKTVGGAALTNTIGRASKDMLGDMVNLQIGYESAFAGVRKTIDATEAEYEKLYKSAIKMSEVMPTAAEDIMGVMESAGQLGVGKNDIDKFTESIIHLGEATNLTLDEAATELAKFAGVMGLPLSEIDKLGSAVVELGNNHATTEKDIVNMMGELKGASSIIGLSVADVAGLATILSSAGLRAEGGGSAMSRVMSNMDSAVRGNTKYLKEYAIIAGVSAQEFATAFKKDPMDALIMMIAGLDELNKKGKDIDSYLGEVNINSAQDKRAIKQMIGHQDSMRATLDMSSKAFKENTALVDEASQRYATTESQIAMLGNKWNNIKSDIGEILIPPLLMLVDVISPLLDSFKSMPDGVKLFIVALLGIGVVIGPILMMIGMMSIGISALGGALALISAPVLIAVGVIVGLGVALYGIVKYWKPIKEFFKNLLGAITGFMGGLVGSDGKIMEWFRGIWDGIKNIFSGSGDIFGGFFEGIKNTFRGIKDYILGVWSSISDGVKGVFEHLGNNEYIQGMKDSFNSLVESFKVMISSIGEYISLLYKKAMENIGIFIEGIKNMFVAWWGLIVTLFEGYWLIIMDIISGNFNKVWEDLVLIFGKLYEKMRDMFVIFSETFIKIKDNVLEVWNMLWGTVYTSMVEFKNSIVDVIRNMKDFIVEGIRMLVVNSVIWFVQFKEQVVEQFKLLWVGIKGVLSSLKESIVESKNTIVDTFKGIDLLQIGKDIISGLINGIKSMWSSLKETVQGMAESIANTLRGRLEIRSPSRVTTSIGTDVMRGLLKGIDDKRDMLERLMTQVGGIVESIDPEIAVGYDDELYKYDSDGILLRGNSEQVGQVTTNIHVAEMTVRNENDIEKVSRRLHELSERRKKESK